MSDDGTERTYVLLPLDRGGFASTEVGTTAPWHCGTLGDLSVTRDGDVYRLEYQAYRGIMGVGYCQCPDDDTGCKSVESDPLVDAPDCKCEAPICPLTCGPALAPEGSHTLTFVDARDGTGLWHVAIDHEFDDDVTFDVDVAAKRFRAHGAGCDADVPIVPTPPR